MGMLLRYTYEVRDSAEYFDEFQDVRMTKDMLDLAKHIVEQKSGRFDPYSRTTTLAKISD
jgi:DNA end-binding protein Ku